MLKTLIFKDMRPRVGHIQYLNCLPIYYGLVKGSGILDLDLVKGTPTELNRLLKRHQRAKKMMKKLKSGKMPGGLGGMMGKPF